MTAGWTISAILHAVVLVCSVIAFVIRPLSTPPTEFLSTDIISATEFTQLTNGSRTAPQADTPKPQVEKVADAKPAEDNPATKIVDKPEIVAAADQPQPPKPEPEQKKPDPKPPTPQPQPQKAEPKQAFAKEPDQKIDPIAEALKKEAKKPDPKTQKKTDTPVPQKKADPTKPQPTFDRTKIAALLDKRDPQRRAITGSTLNNTPALGTATGAAVTLSQNELDALRARLRQCWNVPAGLADARELVVTVRIQFKLDGSLLMEPRVTNSGSHPAFQAASESVLRAIRTCAPYSFLPVAKYEAWKDVIVDFDPREMFRG
jgi:outer membrane biosynthesis protein TonB